jgi:hypothetical protein
VPDIHDIPYIIYTMSYCLKYILLKATIYFIVRLIIKIRPIIGIVKIKKAFLKI